MENRDLKDVFKTVKEKKKKERIERVLIYMSGLLLILIFLAIGLNFFSTEDKTISEPQVKLVKEINQPVATPSVPTEQPLPPPEKPTPLPPEDLQQVQIPKQEDKKQPEVKTQDTLKQVDVKPLEEKKIQETKVQTKPKETELKSEEEKKVQKRTPQKTQEVEPNDKPEVKTQTAKLSKSVDQKQTSQKTKEEEQPTETKFTDKDNIISKVSSGYFSIQIGAFSTREKAVQEKSRYQNAYIIEEGGLYKVLVGKFSSDKEAREYKINNNIDGFIKRLKE